MVCVPRPRVRLLALCALMCIALSSPQATLAQQRTPSPSGKELWKTYPLHKAPRQGSGAARGTARPPASSARAQGVRRAGVRSGGDARPALTGIRILAVLVGPGVLVLLWLARRPRKVRSERAPAQDEPDLGASTTATAPGIRFAPAVDAPGAHIASPPDPHRAWTAEIQWCPTGDDSRFCVVAQCPPDDAGRVVAESRALEWPPADVTSVEAVRAAVQRLAELMISAGWQPLQPGDAWYAQRFAWTPVEAPQHQRRISHGPSSRAAAAAAESTAGRGASRSRS